MVYKRRVYFCFRLQGDCLLGDCKQFCGMSSQAAALQSYNNELVQCLEALKKKRDELHHSILDDEAEKERLESEIRKMTQQLGAVNQRIAKKMVARNDFDKTISETEAAYSKILESSHTLLKFIKNETAKSSSLPSTATAAKKL